MAAFPAPEKESYRSVPQTAKAVLSLRELILAGDIRARERISELAGAALIRRRGRN